MEEVVESVMQKHSGSVGPSGMDLEALQVWLLKLGDHSQKMRLVLNILWSVWPVNQNQPWAVYWAYMSCCLIVLNKITGVRLLVVGEMWCCLLTKCVLKAKGSEATHACIYDQL